MTDELAVQARGLTKRFGSIQSPERRRNLRFDPVRVSDGLTAVDGIDLEIFPGECFGFLGPNGAGKTTTMKMIYGRSPITAGSLHVLGMDAARQPRQIKARLGVVPQENNLDPDFTSAENLVVYAQYFGLRGPDVAARCRDLLEFVQLGEKADVNVEKLSGGMKRRLIIARALVNRPSLLILDEPTTGLDPQARHLVWAKLRELKREGVTQLLTTHYMDEAAQLCDRLVVIDHGRVLALGTPADLIERYAGGAIALELRLAPEHHAPAAAAVEKRAGAHESAGDTLVCYVADDEAAAAAVAAVEAAGLPLQGFFKRPTTLEDVFLRLAGRALREE